MKQSFSFKDQHHSGLHCRVSGIYVLKPYSTQPLCSLWTARIVANQINGNFIYSPQPKQMISNLSKKATKFSHDAHWQEERKFWLQLRTNTPLFLYRKHATYNKEKTRRKITQQEYVVGCAIESDPSSASPTAVPELSSLASDC